MEIGEGNTNEWYLGGISSNNSLCLMLTHSELANSENKEKVIKFLFRELIFKQSQLTNTLTILSGRRSQPCLFLISDKCRLRKFSKDLMNKLEQLC